MELRRELKEEAATVPLLEQQLPPAHKAVFSDPTRPTRDVSIQGRGGREIGAPISASLGAMRPLVRKLDMLLLAPPNGCSSSTRVKDGMRLLKDDVEKMSLYLDKLLEVEDPPPAANCWMNEARDLSYDMEDYMDSLIFDRPEDASIVPNNIKTTRSRFKFFGHAKTPKTKTKVDVIVETLSELRKYVQEAIERHHVYNLHSCSTLRHRFVSLGPMLPAPMQYEDIVIDGRMNGFINSLANDGDQQLKVLSVLGHACLGKTTLARVLYKRLGKQYHCRAFIRVSKKPDTKRIFRDMLAQLQHQHSPQDCKEADLIDNIKKYLQDKRYLIIIDDLWATSVWDIINHAFPKGSQGSRIVTITQIEDIALTCCSYQSEHVFQMEPLDDDHSRKLFFNTLFGSENDCPEELKEVSNKIVEICDGLPLATISIASLLASQPVISTDILTYIHQSLSSCFSANSISERTRQVLSLSYNNLPHYLKTCLLYLSMYQEGHTFCKDDLLKQWVAEGLIDTTEGQDIKEVAESYLGQLIGRRFIQPICINYNNEVLSCEVHDVVYDLIANKSAEENFIVAIDYSCRKNVALYQKVRRLSLQLGGVKYAEIPSNISKAQVRSLGFFGLLGCMPCIGEFKLLRVLNLQLSGHRHRHGDQDPAIELTRISELFHLRYLKIICDVCIKLPNRLRGLQCLETLDVMDTRGLYVPWDVTYLPHLWHLSLPVDTNLLDWSINLGSLGMPNYLQDLYISTPPSSDHLEGSMEDAERILEALSSLIGGHSNLKTMVVAHKSSVRYGRASKAIIYWNNMAPLPNLRRFECSPHNGIIFHRIPRWMEQLGNLCILKIAVSELLIYDVGILGGLPALTALSLYVETSPDDKIIFGKAGFLVLKYFKLRFTSGIAWLKFEADAMCNLLKLKLIFNAIPQMEQYENGIISIEHMPSLRKISVKFWGGAAGQEYGLVNNHQCNPRINEQSSVYSSNGDESRKQKQQPYEILEEERDEYDKKVKSPADQRNSGLMESSLRPHVPGKSHFSSLMTAPNTYTVHVSKETHKIEAWCESDESSARQLLEEEDSLLVTASKDFAGSVFLEPSSLVVEYRPPANNVAQVATEDIVDPDNMSYEQLQAKDQAVGTQSRGLSDELTCYLVPFRNNCNFFSSKKNNEECAICKSNFKSQQKLIRLPCSHSYHADCITRWLKINKVVVFFLLL
ncbi:unnamed protein product [Triticum turgidum subsp. durum]|uniref:RING-type domain-containing protein n=1 Tax=Triticum turgidum subsp. durum TaxID=4567 RepID=A0A9R0Z1M1_TRITD|nr:unnamed protein product [Triticum turgidum subsp. durum]